MEETKELKIDIKENSVEKKHQKDIYDNELQTCCSGTSDKRCLEFGVKAFVICGVLTVSSSMLIYNNVHGNDCSSMNSIYSSIITLIVGVFLPSPIKKKDVSL
jgi:hypothetical protein